MPPPAIPSKRIKQKEANCVFCTLLGTVLEWKDPEAEQLIDRDQDAVEVEEACNISSSTIQKSFPWLPKLPKSPGKHGYTARF